MRWIESLVRVYSGERVAMAVEKLQEQKDAWRSNPIEEHYGISGER
jgi:hypothetical protein